MAVAFQAEERGQLLWHSGLSQHLGHQCPELECQLLSSFLPRPGCQGAFGGVKQPMGALCPSLSVTLAFQINTS